MDKIFGLTAKLGRSYFLAFRQTRQPFHATHDSPLPEALSPREHLPENAPTAKLTRIDTADRPFSVPLTHNQCTGVCRYVRGISVGISRRVASLWGAVGSQRPLTSLADQLQGA